MVTGLAISDQDISCEYPQNRTLGLDHDGLGCAEGWGIWRERESPSLLSSGCKKRYVDCCSALGVAHLLLLSPITLFGL